MEIHWCLTLCLRPGDDSLTHVSGSPGLGGRVFSWMELKGLLPSLRRTDRQLCVPLHSRAFRA